jgi:hypothetical protein
VALRQRAGRTFSFVLTCEAEGVKIVGARVVANANYFADEAAHCRRAVAFIREIRLLETCPNYSAVNDPLIPVRVAWLSKHEAPHPFRHLSPSIAPKQHFLTVFRTVL